MAKKQTHGRAPGKTQISISLPEDLVGKIDRLAATENRNRSNFIATHLESLAGELEASEPPKKFKKKATK
ncbi:ribbon-helix-helix domain-containing protein [Cerasicoccus frondis]|uniref:ribbon-helix-helix domain-containing protein n=1 Tax=Cerasicoccus frondis TaxID=490090 RepID=UPI002852B526|nr:ribbon-helix-helix domain-containing protein [Cerasicoccus frondis]